MDYRIKLPDKLIPVFENPLGLNPNQPIIRYRGAHGGRGSGKTHSFAKMAATIGAIAAQAGITGLIVCGREFMNSLADSSFAEIKSIILEDEWLSSVYDCGQEYIRTKCGRVSFAFVGLRHNLHSVKSKARILILWVDEAENVSGTAWDIVINTVRAENSEIWVTWNPEKKDSATNKRFNTRQRVLDADMRIVEINWSDNPKFPKVLEAERQRCLRDNPDNYAHIWEGDYISVVEGAYYAKHLTQARAENRICHVARDTLQPVHIFCDIGGTSGKSDAFVMIPTQRVGLGKRALDYYEAVGQEFSEHVHWLRSNGYDDAIIMLPHDGNKHDNVFRVTPRSYFEQAGFKVEVMPNEGSGAAMLRIESGRRDFGNWHFNEAKCTGLIDALANYHEKKDEKRNIGLGVNHDWSSHGADAFGGACIWYEQHQPKKQEPVKIIQPVNIWGKTWR